MGAPQAAGPTERGTNAQGVVVCGFFFDFFLDLDVLAGAGVVAAGAAVAAAGVGSGAADGAGSGAAAGSGAGAAADSAAAGSAAEAPGVPSAAAALGSAGGGVSLEPPPHAAMAVATTSGEKSTMDFQVGMTRNLRGSAGTGNREKVQAKLALRSRDAEKRAHALVKLIVDRPSEVTMNNPAN